MERSRREHCHHGQDGDGKKRVVDCWVTSDELTMSPFKSAMSQLAADFFFACAAAYFLTTTRCAMQVVSLGMSRASIALETIVTSVRNCLTPSSVRRWLTSS